MLDMICEIKERLNSLVKIGVLSLSLSGKTRNLQVKLTKDEVINDVKFIEQYGFTANPIIGSEVVMFNLNGFADKPIALTVGGRNFRLTDLKQGEVAIYTDEGDKILLKRNHNIEITTKTLTLNAETINLNASSKVNVTTPLMEATNDFKANQVSDVFGSMIGIRNIYNAHTHTTLNVNAETTNPNDLMEV